MIEWNKFKTTKEDYELINQIVYRVINEGVFFEYKKENFEIDLTMDLECAFNNDGINLQKLLEFSDMDFAHDVHGIYFNLNRQTGKLENNFVPRSTN
ncbi:MAG: hypothetical protein IH950_16270 [Bacteroidetes bacterium]|nr:hypothetical protein [Bacteroidota bacterium]